MTPSLARLRRIPNIVSLLVSLLLLISVANDLSCTAFLTTQGPSKRRQPLERRLQESADSEDTSVQAKISTELGLDEAPCIECQETRKSLARDRGLAISSALLATLAFVFQRSNPVSAVALLRQMEADSPALTRALDNGKPTVIDIYAEWCDNCKSLAPVTRQLEREFGDTVNWVTVRGDAAAKENQAVVRALRADAIPHYAFIRADGEVETSLVGAVPARVLRDDVQALAERRRVPFTQFDIYRDAPSHNIRDYLGRDFFLGASSQFVLGDEM